MFGLHRIAERVSAAVNADLNEYFRICRAWMREQLAHPDDEQWFAMWYPASTADMA
ncbi:hypothetical protein [Bifidobacterium sp. SO1]|uniref:hypothetical protein n=1 Tax=Bifidobacterium sp. SO1 TaxID=2809029 RepID=UPI001BDC8EC4|nr:hypothetical protein [Bifidobacterium sp. SO1]MBT1160776.1 hypothetical protein [Bifidobacterium sp. SO1]